MIEAGKYWGFIWSAYAVMALAVIGLTAWLVIDGRRRLAELDALEKRGVRRKSQSG